MAELKRPPTYNDDDTITIYLTKGFVAVIDAVDADLAQLNWRGQHSTPGYPYAVRSIRENGKSGYEYLHKTILLRSINRELDPRELVDHKDTDTLNNRRSNLRPATVSQNTQNQKKRCDGNNPYKGVTWDKTCKKWKASIKRDGKTYYLGLFNDPLEAHNRYIEKATEFFGEFMRAA